MQTTTQSPQDTARYIISLYNQYGGEDYIGEPVSQLEHMQQCAQLAEQEGYDEEVVLPVQHMDGFGIVDHEKLGADFLRSQGFSEKIAQLVQNHVEAKRYLTFRYPEYYEKLSEASKRTLEFQGGRMTAEEAAAFEADPLYELHIKLRRWDEGAKLEHQPLQPMLYYESMMVRHLQQTIPH